MINLYTKLALKFNLLFRFSNKKIAKKDANYSASVLEKRTNFMWPLMLMLPALTIIILFTVVPFIYTTVSAVTPREHLAIARSSHFNLVLGFKRVFANTLFVAGLRNSVVYGLVSLPITLALALLISSSIAVLYRKWAKGFWQTIFFLPYVTSGVAISLTFVNLFDTRFGLINSVLGQKIPWLVSAQSEGWYAFGAILILGVWQNLAFNILIFTTAMLSVDRNLYKSASIDGSGQLKQFFKITLPSIKKTTSFLITIGVIGGFKVFPLALFANDPNRAFSNGGATLILFVYREVVASRFEAAGATSLVIFAIGLAYTVTLRTGIDLIGRLSTWIGEIRVYKKVTNPKLVHKTKAW